MYVNMYTLHTVIWTRPNFHTQSGYTLRENVHIPMWKSRLKQQGRFPLDPAILAAIKHCVIANL